MPRLNAYGEVATDHRGWAAGARWRDDETCIFQQPVTTDADVWQMATRSRHLTGRGEPIPGVVGGCNALAAGGGLWMRRLDGTWPLLSGNTAWRPHDGRVGDIDGHDLAGWVTLSEDALTLRFYDHEYRRDDVQGETRLLRGLACWTSRGRVRVYDRVLRIERPVAQVGDGAAFALAFTDHVGAAWVLYQTDDMGGVLHPIGDATRGYRYGPTCITPHTEGIYDPDVRARPDGSAIIVWAAREGQHPEDIRRFEIGCLGEDMVPLVRMSTPEPPVEPPPPLTPPPLPPAPPVYDPLPFLRAIYRELLRRDPDAYGLGYYGARLIDGRMTEADVRADITRSQEYRALHAPPALTGLAGFSQASVEAATELKESNR